MARLTRGGELTGALGLVLMFGISASGQSEPIPETMPLAAAEAASSQDALAQVEASISLSKERVERLKAEIEAMRGDRDKQNAALIAAGERVKLAEADVAAVEQKIGDLIVSELDTRGRLDGADGSISNVLAALQRISRNPPPALIVDPSDALGSARSAILISAILPQLRARADQVLADLHKLDTIKRAAEDEEGRLKANFDILEEEQLRIATLIAAQKQNEAVANASIAAEGQLGADLAAKAASLKQLVDSLSRRAQAVQSAAEATERANQGATPRLDSETVRLALANTERTEPAVPFVSAKGFLAFPSSGVPVINYGDGDGFGGISQGLSVVTRAGAAVSAPADGWVLYTGDYLNYGQIVILDGGQDYTILLAGLAEISVTPGQFVLMGQQLGTMGSRTIGRTVATSAGAQNPTLYIEMRKSSVPIDPTGWWASNDTMTQSG
ncbi:MAG: peptidoglycan DD-metalloendopeptidase family protein [Devosia sp.]